MKPTFSSFIMIAALTFQSSAFAGLGEKESAISKDKSALSVSEKSQSKTQLYTVHELSQNSRRIKEYANTEGVVFAVTWRGNAHPDLTSLLGNYLEEYQSAVQNQKMQKGHKRVGMTTTANLVVEKSGTLRASQGRAYVPSLVPAGVSLNDIQ